MVTYYVISAFKKTTCIDSGRLTDVPYHSPQQQGRQVCGNSLLAKWQESCAKEINVSFLAPAQMRRRNIPSYSSHSNSSLPGAELGNCKERWSWRRKK